MATIDVKDAAGSTVAIEKPLAPGRAAASASRPVALSNEDAAYLDGIETKLDTLHTDLSQFADASTGTSTQVASQTGAITILAANADRLGGSVYNDDANALYLLLGTGTVTSSVYTVQIPANGYYEIPQGFTGILTGLWAANGSGSARVTELTP